MKKLCVLCFLLLGYNLCSASSLSYNLTGVIVDASTQTPLPGARILINDDYLWAVSDKDGKFHIDGIAKELCEVEVSLLGYASESIQCKSPYASQLRIELKVNSLELEQVIVVAQRSNQDLNTSYTIGRDALNQTHMSDISAITSLLPGGKTSNPDLTSDTRITLRGGDIDNGNASFGTAIEVDGVRISNNGSFDALSGVGIRGIAIDNIESVEVIMGVPSVEYGDVGSGVVRINTQRGVSALQTNLSINPRTYQASASKGLKVSDRGDVLNLSTEWARATSSIVSPYTSYTRLGFSAIYSSTFKENIRFESGVTVNFGGMNSEDDPDAYSGEYSTARDNSIRANISTQWLANRAWATNLKFDLSVNYQDRTTHDHKWNSSASQQPAVHATEEGYFIATQLPYSYFSDGYEESKEIDMAAAIKYELNHNIGALKGRFKAGVQWKMTGNIGRGKYYSSMATAPNGFRERDYRDYPFMHNVSLYAEERITIPMGSTELTLVPGVRVEEVYVDGAAYDNTVSLSPRFNGALKVNKDLTIRGGWGITEKLPSYYVLFPEQSYRDIRSFSGTYNNNQSIYTYYTLPYALESNPDLKWQRNQNAEVGVDAKIAGTKIAITAFSNKTMGAYQYSSYYTPFTYNTYKVPDSYSETMQGITNPEIKVDAQTGDVYIRDADVSGSAWTAMDVNVTNTTFTKTTYADNGADVLRRGLEVVIDFPEIKPLRTRFRFDAAYTYVDYLDNALSFYYQQGLSHTTESNQSYQYVGIYATGNSSSSWIYNGYTSHGLNANVTAITHIPSARLVISCRVEMTLLNRWRYRSEYNGQQYAFNSDADGNPTSGSIYDGDSYTTIWPVKYMDRSGSIYDFTSEQAADPDFANLIRTSSNTYTFNQGGYDPYVYANLSVTKEIGRAVSLSLYANNFTFSRKAVESYSTGVSAVFVPNFYYGLSCRVKF